MAVGHSKKNKSEESNNCRSHGHLGKTKSKQRIFLSLLLFISSSFPDLYCLQKRPMPYISSVFRSSSLGPRIHAKVKEWIRLPSKSKFCVWASGALISLWIVCGRQRMLVLTRRDQALSFSILFGSSSSDVKSRYLFFFSLFQNGFFWRQSTPR